MKNKITKIALSLFLCSCVLSACGLINLTGQTANNATVQPAPVENSTIVSEGNLVPQKFKYISFLRAGRVGEILVKVGDSVKEGDVIARLGDRQQVDANLASAQLDLLSAQQSYDDLLRTAKLVQDTNQVNLLQAQSNLVSAQRAWDAVDTKEYQNKIDEANVRAQNAKTTLDNAQKEFEKYKDLSSDNANYKTAKDSLDKAQKDYNEEIYKRDELTIKRDLVNSTRNQAQANVSEAEFKFNLTQSGADSQKLALAEARLAASKTQLSAAQFAIETLEIKAPFTGEIVDINVDVNEQVGTSTWAFLIADFSQWFVETSDLTELKVVKIVEGMPADLTADALPGVHMTGVVAQIAKNFKTISGDINYKALIKLENRDPLLRWGMTIQVTFVAKP